MTADELARTLQRAVSCVTPAVLRIRADASDEAWYILAFGPGAGSIVLGVDRRFALRTRHFYRLTDPERQRRPRQASTVGYVADLLDGGGALVVGYHWHPVAGGAIGYPHLHVGRQFAQADLPPDQRAVADRLVRSHLPTGPILLPTVLRLAIAEFGVEPLRRDWAAVLDESETALRASLATPA